MTSSSLLEEDTIDHRELHFVQTTSSSSSEISNWKWAMRKMEKRRRLRTHLSLCQQQEFAIISIADFSLIHSHISDSFWIFGIRRVEATATYWILMLLFQFCRRQPRFRSSRSSSVVLPRWSLSSRWRMGAPCSFIPRVKIWEKKEAK